MVCGATSRSGVRSAGPADPEFQHRVLRHAFSLLDATGPVFEVFPEAIHDDGTEVLACTLPPRDDPDLHPAVDEARGLRHAYDRAVARYGEPGRHRTGGRRRRRPGRGRGARAGSSTGTPWKEAGVPGIPARVAQDIRGYYETAALGLVRPRAVGVVGDPLVLRPYRRPARSSCRLAPRCATPTSSSRSGSTWRPATADMSPSDGMRCRRYVGMSGSMGSVFDAR